jgi:hypothetical protein
MSEAQDTTHSPDAARFESELARVLFVPPEEITDEQRLSCGQRMLSWLSSATKAQLHQQCSTLDQQIIPLLSGTDFLQLAAMIERSHKELFKDMPNLAIQRDHLIRVQQISSVFHPESILKMAIALKKEAS